MRNLERGVRLRDPVKSRFRGMIIKGHTPLMLQLRKYYRWKTSGGRYLYSAFMLPTGMIKIQTTVESEIPQERVDKRLTEYINPRTMALEIKHNSL